MTKADDEKFRKKLTPDQYAVLRQRGTEPPFSGALLHNNSTGIYRCAACGQELFKSDHKFDSGSGWPSFYEVMDSKNVDLIDDDREGLHRIEVKCSRCGSHLGHVFDDAPQVPTGKRYCINSLALSFKNASNTSEGSTNDR